MDCSMGMATILPPAKRADQGRILLGYLYCMNSVLSTIRRSSGTKCMGSELRRVWGDYPSQNPINGMLISPQ